MKFVTYRNNNLLRAGLLIDNKIADLNDAGNKFGMNIPDNMLDIIAGGDSILDNIRELEQKIKSSGYELIDINAPLAAPIPKPISCRDGYAFRQHVAAARRNRGVDMIAEFDQYPIFYFTNHNAIFGEGDILVEEDHLHKLDFELEWAAVIGKHGKNVDSSEADNYIFGYTIMNDWSARTLQMEEMLLNLGPAKGKDFATTIGPFIITPDELELRKIKTEFGNQYDLGMKAYHNGKQVSYGNTKDMTWTFAEIIERVSYGVEIFPGEVIGSGTVGTGCYLELNGTWAREAKEKGEDFSPIWIKNGDTFTLEVDMLGQLTNNVVLSDRKKSILKKKKNV